MKNRILIILAGCCYTHNDDEGAYGTAVSTIPIAGLTAYAEIGNSKHERLS